MNLSLEVLAYPIVFLVAFTSIGILVAQSWRWALLLLVIQYAGVFVLSSLSWPYQLVLVKVIAGWMAAMLLWMAQTGLSTSQADNDAQEYGMARLANTPHFSGWVFRFIAAGIVGMVVLSVTPTFTQWLPRLNEAQILGSLVLIGIGLLQIGFTSNPFWGVLGLLTILSGFEIIYSGVVISALVQALLAVVNLGLGAAGAYMILSATMESAQ